MVMLRSACVAVAFVVAVFGCSFSSFAAEPVRETFTYQGVLNDGGAPANGMYDIQIQFYDELGNPFATTVAYLDFEVVDGLLSFPIDLGNVFTVGQRRFLQVRVRQAGGSVYTDLSPRQEVTASPFAVYAIKAGEAETAVMADTAAVAVTSLDNEWVRSGDLLSVGDTNESILVNPSLTGGNPLNQFTDLQLNFENSSFGGMYINSVGSGGSPFYGFAMNNSTAAFMEYSPAFNQVRFFIGSSFTPALSLGEDTAVVDTLVAGDDVVKDYGSGDFYRHGPIAYGTVGSNGTVISGTGNFSAAWDGGLGRYVIQIDDENVSSSFYTMVANAGGASPAVVNTASAGGDMLVYIHSLSNVNIQRTFSFAIYKNSAWTAD